MGVICNEENGSKCHHMHVIREFIILFIYFNMKLSWLLFYSHDCPLPGVVTDQWKLVGRKLWNPHLQKDLFDNHDSPRLFVHTLSRVHAEVYLECLECLPLRKFQMPVSSLIENTWRMLEGNIWFHDFHGCLWDVLVCQRLFRSWRERLAIHKCSWKGISLMTFRYTHIDLLRSRT